MVRSRAASRLSSPSTGSPRTQPPHPRLQPLQSPSPRLGFPGLSWASWASSESSASSMHVLRTPSSQRQDYESLVPVFAFTGGASSTSSPAASVQTNSPYPSASSSPSSSHPTSVRPHLDRVTHDDCPATRRGVPRPRDR
ncbi:hypothetical protein V495_01781 [Pseudogymnoascus sp. VKM F-4514 (FW-929)]|nr:hypothetical protein V495_01781 [Pseudogymnoascus sp. VKM F-4514 (FW-929)]KFY57972.1 hypothetical protein V497_05149 [Pseudogymnoascus sp. VKM F-4516 (FW-969)]